MTLEEVRKFVRPPFPQVEITDSQGRKWIGGGIVIRSTERIAFMYVPDTGGSLRVKEMAISEILRICDLTGVPSLDAE